MMVFLLLVIGGAALAWGAFFAKSPASRARARRIDAFKVRHAAAFTVETQLRRITAARATALEITFHRLIPNPDLLRRRIEMTGKSWTLGQYAGASAGLTAVVWALLFTRGVPPVLTVLAGLLVGVGLPYWFTGKLATRRTQRFTAKFPDAIDLLVRGLRSGLPISETMSVVGKEVPDPVGSEFRGVADRMRIGRTMEAALQESADRLVTPEFQFFVITLAIQRETGGNLAETLSNLSDVLRKRMQMRLKIRAMSSESKASAYIIGSLPFIVFALIWYINPGYMSGFFSDQRLVMAAAGGGVWMGIGVFIMGKMISFEI